MKHESASSFFGSKPVKSPNANSRAKLLAGHVRAFCTNQAEKQALLDYGFSERDVFDGGQFETLDALLETYRDRPGTLAIAADDMRLLGAKRADLFATLRRLEKLKIQIVDIAGRSFSVMVEYTIQVISKARFMGDRRKARRCGSKGGIARGISAWNKRDEIAPRWLLCNMVAALGARKTAELVENKISESSFRRNYKII